MYIYKYIYFRLLIDFTEDTTLPSWKGYVLALGLMVQKFVTVFTNRQLHGIYYINFTMRIRSALTTAIYKKVILYLFGWIIETSSYEDNLKYSNIKRNRMNIFGKPSVPLHYSQFMKGTVKIYWWQQHLAILKA